jgi:RimJ/RimL family protein N-acetyltransferase
MSVLHDAVTWPIHTARLSLRPATGDDLEATWAFRRLPEVSQWLTRAPATLEEYREQFEDPDSLAKTVVIELDGQVIGDLMLDVQDGWSQAEVAGQARATQGDLGWVLHPEHTGHGYATEAVQALLEAALADLGLRRVTASCFADNEASWRLMERLGMSRETYAVADSLHRSRRWLDSMAYALLADEPRDTWSDARVSPTAPPLRHGRPDVCSGGAVAN